MNIDPLAWMALVGFVSVLVVTAGVFGWLITRGKKGD